MAWCVCSELRLGKDGWRALEGGSEAGPFSYGEKRGRDPEAATIEERSDPGERKRTKARGNGAADGRRTGDREHEQAGEQEERDHAAHAGEKQSLIVRKAEDKQEEALFSSSLPVALRLGHITSVLAIVRPGRCGVLRHAAGDSFRVNWGVVFISLREVE
jgi:hypothetical protein